MAFLQLCEPLSSSFLPRLSASFHVVLGLPWVNQCHEIPSNPPANTLSPSSSCPVFLGVPCPQHPIGLLSAGVGPSPRGGRVAAVAWAGLRASDRGCCLPSSDHRSKDSGQGAGRTQIRDADSHQGEAGTAAKCPSVLGPLESTGLRRGIQRGSPKSGPI